MVLDSLPSRNDEFTDLERHDLLTGEPRYVEDEIRNVHFSKIFGILGLIFALISMVLVWVLYRRDRNRTFLWHAIWMAVISLFFIVAIAWAFMASTAVKSGKQPGAIFSGLIFILSLAYIGYLLVESVWLILYRKIHFDYLVGLNTDQDAWNNRMPSGYSFTDGWKQDRKMIWWIVFFNLFAIGPLALIAYAARSVSWNRYTLARATLYVALTVMALAGWLMIYWVEEAYEYQNALPGKFLGNLLKVTKAWAIVALAVAGVNAFVNFFQYKIGFFIVALLEIGLIIAMVMTVGVILREVREAEFSGFFPGGCATTQYSIHENALDDRWCSVGGKYLAAGQMCRKADMVTRWEGNNEIRSLNPGCCSSSNYYYIYPFLLVGFWTLVCIFSAAVAVGCNLYLADTNEYLTATNRAFGIIDFVGLAAVIAMIVAWGIYFLVRNANKLAYSPNPNFAAYNDPYNNRIQGFDLVPDAIKVSSNTTAPFVVNDGCIGFNNSGSAYPTFSTTAPCTDRVNCVLRLAMLFKDTTVTFPTNGGAAQGSTTNRALFFPSCTSTLNDYLFYYGTEDQLRTLLNSLRICPRSTGSTGATYFMYVDQVAKADLQTNGQLNTEPAVPNVITNVDGPACGAGFSNANTCVGSCRLARSVSQVTDTAPIKGQLYYLQNGVRNLNIHNLVTVAAYNRNDKIGGPATLYVNGLFTILNIPRFSSNNYIATIDITDAAGVFLQKKVDLLIPTAGTANPEISAGFIRLDTKDGIVCGQTDTVCKNNQVQRLGNIQGTVRDGTGEFASASSPLLEGSSVQLIRWHQVAGQSFGNLTTGAGGAFFFANIPYDSYSIIANKTGFKPVIAKIDLQEPSLVISPIILRPMLDPWDIRILAEINEPSADFDLNMMARSDKGAECTVNPTNKYCAYSAYVNDVAFGAGEEDILVKKLAVASYMAWLAPSAPYNNNCPAGVSASINSQQYHSQVWNWDAFKQTRSLSQLNIDTNTFGPSTLDSSNIGSGLGLLGLNEPVETTAESQTGKQVLNRDGVPVTGTIIENTNFGNGTVTPPPVNTIPSINGTVTSNNTVNVTSGPCTSTVSSVQYTNNTALGFVNVTRSINLSVCQNGTNFTEDNTTASYFGYDKQRAEVLNRTFTTAYSNGTSRIERNNSNFTYPNASFEFLRNQSNTSIITGVNTNVSPGTPSPINVANTNHTYNESILETYYPNSTGLSNTTNSSIVEIDYRNSSITQNFSKNFSFNFIPAVNVSGNGTQNTSSFQIYDYGNVTLRENCNLSTLVNGSTLIQCNVFNLTSFLNGTNSSSNGSKNNVLTQDINAGANIVRLNTSISNFSSSNLVFFNRTDNFTSIKLPNGTNSTVAVVNTSQNLSNTDFRLYSFDWDVNDINKTNTTVQNYSDFKNVTNGTMYLISLFFNRTTTPNGSNFTIKNLSNNTRNGTNQSNGTYNEIFFSNFTANSSNNSWSSINSTFNVSGNFGIANYSISNFSNETDFNVGTFMRFTRNNSNYSYPNGTNFSYFVETNLSNTSNLSNFSVGNLSILFNYSNNSSVVYHHSFNQTVLGNLSTLSNNSNNSNGSNSSNGSNNSSIVTIITWDNETRQVRNVSGINESFSDISFNITNLVPAAFNNSSAFINNSYSENLSQNLSYSNNTTINITMNESDSRNYSNLSSYNESNVTAWAYNLTTMGGDNSSWSFYNLSQISTAGGNNTTLWIQKNLSLVMPSNDSSINKTNSSLYNYSNLSSFNNGSVINTSNLSINLSIGSNSSNATKFNSTVYWRNSSHNNGTNQTTFIEERNKTSPASNNNSNISFFNHSNFTLNAPNTSNVSANLSSINVCLAINDTSARTNTCNFTYNLSNGTNDTNTSYINNSIDLNQTNYSNGSNYSYFFNQSNQSLLNGTAPRINITYFLLRETNVHPPINGTNLSSNSNSSNGTNNTNATNSSNNNGSSLNASITNFSRFIECFIEQNFTGNYSNCSNDSLIQLGQNLSSLFNLSNWSEENVTVVLNNLTNTTNYSLEVLLLNSSNGSLSDSISLYQNLTAPITVNGTQLNLTNVSSYSRNFSQNRSDYILAFNESNYSKNVGVSLDNSSSEVNNSKRQINTTFLDGNISNSSLNMTVIDHWFNITHDYRYKTANQTYVNNYSHNHSELYSPDNKANHSNISRNYSSNMNSSLYYNLSNVSFNSSNHTGSNLNSVFHNNLTISNSSQEIYAPSSANHNNTSLVQNYTVFIFNMSSGDARNRGVNSTLGIDGVNFTYRNFSLNTSQAVNMSINGTNPKNVTIGFNTLNWTLNNLTGTYRNGSNGVSYRNYTYALFNLSLVNPNVSSNTSVPFINNTYDFFLYDSNNVSGGLNTTLTIRERLSNSTENISLNTSYRLWDLLVCQANGSCAEIYFSNSSDNNSAPNASNNTYSRNFTSNYTNSTSNTTDYDQNHTYSNSSLNENRTFFNYSSNRSLQNGSNYSQFNSGTSVNITVDNVSNVANGTLDSLNFSSPRDNDGNATGLIRTYLNRTSYINQSIINDSWNVVTQNLTSDVIELPAGVKSVFYNSTNRTYDNNSVNFTETSQFNSSMSIPAATDGTLAFQYLNITSSKNFVDSPHTWWKNSSTTLSGFVAAYHDTTFGYRNCSFNFTNNSILHKNNSNVTLVSNTSTCYFVNNHSDEVNTTTQFFMVVDVTAHSPVIEQNKNFTRLINGEVVLDSSNDVASQRRRRMLMEKPAESHAQGGTGGNFIFISCFTGFGTASIINVNSIVDNQPTMDACLTRLNGERPKYTVSKLRAAYNDYVAKFPGAA